jgi:hypothetical protein
MVAPRSVPRNAPRRYLLSGRNQPGWSRRKVERKLRANLRARARKEVSKHPTKRIVKMEKAVAKSKLLKRPAAIIRLWTARRKRRLNIMKDRQRQAEMYLSLRPKRR